MYIYYILEKISTQKWIPNVLPSKRPLAEKQERKCNFYTHKPVDRLSVFLVLAMSSG